MPSNFPPGLIAREISVLFVRQRTFEIMSDPDFVELHREIADIIRSSPLPPPWPYRCRR
jgi:hypothetical protein